VTQQPQLPHEPQRASVNPALPVWRLIHSRVYKMAKWQRKVRIPPAPEEGLPESWRLESWRLESWRLESRRLDGGRCEDP
jgi:hypothetical protein